MIPALINAGVRLAGLLEAENRALASLDLASAAALAEPKRAAVAAFVAAETTARKSGAHAGESEREAVRTLSERLGDLAAANRRMLERALAASGIALIRTAVGDKYVLEEMVRRSLPLGGEQSGHVIFREFSTTGDGMMTALRVLDAARRAGRPLDELVSGFEIYPQRLVNVRFQRKRPLEELPSVQECIRAAETHFGERGRVLVRFSGTEPLARVMVEGPDPAHVETHARRIARAIEEALSA